MILFTSGSEGPPKGVVLSHRNMLANAAQAAARIDFGREDKLFNVLPMFHSFGLTAGTVLPLVSGVLDLSLSVAAALSHRAGTGLRRLRHRLFGTDTFLNGYARVANPYDFRSLRYVFAGAEPVKAFDAPDLSGKIRAAHPRRLWRDRMLAGDGDQHADVQQIRHRRPAAARHGGEARKGRRRRRGRPAVRQGAERHARLSARRQAGRARTAAGGLARHRRHRRHRRAGLCRHQGPRQALRQGRRRDGLACRGRDAGGRAVAEQRHRGRRRAGCRARASG